MRAYTGQLTATQFSGLRHVRLHSARPLASPETLSLSLTLTLPLLLILTLTLTLPTDH